MYHLLRIKSILIIAFCAFASSCQSEEEQKIEIFSSYYSDLKENPDSKWRYSADTVRLWFDDKSGEPIIQVQGAPSEGAWTEWDKEMNAHSHYDSLWYDPSENMIRGFFFENNDFYKLIGKGPTKTLQSYWLNDEDKISEILIYWIPEENTHTSEHLKPIVLWAQENDSLEIERLYPNERIVPSRENAVRWKKLIGRYNAELKSR